jgi:DNA-directed RNA polymerase subunit E'/Rpb7
MEVFVKSLLMDRVRLAPSEVAKDYRDTVATKLRAKVEGKCSRHGYVRPNSVDIVRIQPGTLRMFSLNGDVMYTVYYKALVCNPAVGSIVEAKVTNTNKFGVLAEVQIDVSDDHGAPKRTTVMEIIIAKQGAFASDINLHTVEVGDVVNIEILGKKFELNDKRISSFGKIVKKTAEGHEGDETEAEAPTDVSEASEAEGESDAESPDEEEERSEVEGEVESEVDAEGGAEEQSESGFDINDEVSLSDFDEDAFEEEDAFEADADADADADDLEPDQDDVSVYSA